MPPRSWPYASFSPEPAPGAAVLVSGHDAEQSFDDYRVMEIVGGRATERTATRAGPSDTNVAVTLVDLTGRLDSETVLGLAGVIEAGPRKEERDLGRRIVVHVSQAHTDRFLVASISAGWSVVNVLPVGDRTIEQRSS